jgi:tyrosinase
MAVVRRNILTNTGARLKFIQGVTALKAEPSGRTTASLGIPGPSKQLSTYDVFVVWHHLAMNTFTPPADMDRNAAHRGPVFLPWHRYMLIQLEANIQRVLGDATFGLPYWNWAADGERPKADQPNSALWKPNCMGGNGDPNASDSVQTGPFSASSGWRVEVAENFQGVLQSVHRPLRRQFDVSLGLPTKSQVQTALNRPKYDDPLWDAAVKQFRNRLEGWVPGPNAGLHNRVHVWVSGDMLLGSSPNDPVFYLNHCNVDRIWARRQRDRPNEPYRPPQSASQDLFRHRRNYPMYSIFTAGNNGPPVNQMLNVSSIYTYGSLAVS